MNFTANYAGATYTHGYTLNDKNQRTGIALADGKNWNFSYDNIGQVTGAMLNNSGNLLNTYSYNYDQIGNRIQAVKDNDTTSYTSNIVNQYTQINTSVPTYDQDGNMLTNGEWSYTWNGENRMILAQTTTRKVEFAYDYMGRCFERKEYTAANGSWNLDKTVYIVYDEYKQIAEYVNGELHQQYVWDVAGIDTVAFMGKNNSTYMYLTDGNKNALKLFDATGVQANYSYDPFGKVATSEGLLATDNPFRFSSEYHNDITGLVEYIYRKYDSVMGRWINRDPIEEEGGLNLYLIAGKNDCVSLIDYYGLDWLDCVSNCIKANDILAAIERKAIAMLLGGGIPKRLVYKILLKMGETRKANVLLSAIKNPKTFANELAFKPIKIVIEKLVKKNAKIIAQKFTNVSVPAFVVYGNVLLVIELECCCHCFIFDRYTPEKFTFNLDRAIDYYFGNLSWNIFGLSESDYDSPEDFL